MIRRHALYGVLAVALAALAGCTEAATPPPAVASAAAPSPTVSAPAPVAVFVGDSYTMGTGASGPARRWIHLVSRRMGWVGVNLGFGGTGYGTSLDGVPQACGRDHCPSYAEMIDEVVAANPDIVIVSGGRNDVPEPGLPPRIAGVESFFVSLHQAVPDARIIATSPIWDDDPAPAELTAVRHAVRSGVAAVGGTYLDLGDPLLGRPELVAEDGVHPTDAGHEALADAFQRAYGS